MKRCETPDGFCGIVFWNRKKVVQESGSVLV